jgi:hypothetical protein
MGKLVKMVGNYKLILEAVVYRKENFLKSDRNQLRTWNYLTVFLFFYTRQMILVGILPINCFLAKNRIIGK